MAADDAFPQRLSRALAELGAQILRDHEEALSQARQAQRETP